MEQNGNKISLGLFGGILIAFLLPFATFSCQGMELGSLSGYELAVGKDMETKTPENPFAGLMDSTATASTDEAAATQTTEADPNFFAIAGLALAVVGIALSLSADRRRAAATAAVAAAGALTLLLLKGDLSSRFREAITEGQNAAGGAGANDLDQMGAAMAQMFKVEMKEGWMLALVLFIAALALNAWRATRKPAAPAYAAPAPAAPPPYTTTTTTNS